VVPLKKKSKKPMAILSIEPKEEARVPIVKSPSRILDKRMGKGFSLKEIKAASIPLDEFFRLNLRIDKRRGTIYDSNVEFLGKKYRELLSEELVEREALDKIEKKIMDSVKILSRIPSISKTNAKKLVDAGVKTIDNLIEEDPNTLARDVDEKVSLVQAWINDAKKFQNLLALDDAIRDLCQIDIINKEKAKLLASLGITSVDILAEETPSVLAEDIGISEYLAGQWIKKAGELVKTVAKPKKKTDKRKEPVVKVAKKHKVVKPEELNLNDIGGIGKEDLKKLTDLEISTLKQLAEEDPLEISSIIGVGKDKTLAWINSAREMLGMSKLTMLKKLKEKKMEEGKLEEGELEEVVDFATLEEELIEKPEEVKEKKPKEEKLAEEKIKGKVEIMDKEKKEILRQLNKIKGVGKVSGEKLINAGIKSIQDLIDADIQDLSKKSGIKETTLQKYVDEAKKVTED
jgi:large subunit ribosomal protein L13e